MEIKRLTKEELQDFTRLKGCKIENLYYRGDISLLQKPEKIIALIGRRNADADVLRNANEVSTPMLCIAPIKVVSKTEQSSEKYLQELPIKGFVLEAVPLSSFEHKANEPYADRANKGLFTKPPIHWQMMPKEYFGLCFAFQARA